MTSHKMRIDYLLNHANPQGVDITATAPEHERRVATSHAAGSSGLNVFKRHHSSSSLSEGSDVLKRPRISQQGYVHDGMRTFGKLPNELKAQIIGYLPVKTRDIFLKYCETSPELVLRTLSEKDKSVFMHGENAQKLLSAEVFKPGEKDLFAASLVGYLPSHQALQDTLFRNAVFQIARIGNEIPLLNPSIEQLEKLQQAVQMTEHLTQGLKLGNVCTHYQAKIVEVLNLFDKRANRYSQMLRDKYLLDKDIPLLSDVAKNLAEALACGKVSLHFQEAMLRFVDVHCANSSAQVGKKLLHLSQSLSEGQTNAYLVRALEIIRKDLLKPNIGHDCREQTLVNLARAIVQQSQYAEQRIEKLVQQTRARSPTIANVAIAFHAMHDTFQHYSRHLFEKMLGMIKSFPDQALTTRNRGEIIEHLTSALSKYIRFCVNMENMTLNIVLPPIQVIPAFQLLRNQCLREVYRAKGDLLTQMLPYLRKISQDAISTGHRSAAMLNLSSAMSISNVDTVVRQLLVIMSNLARQTQEPIADDHKIIPILLTKVINSSALTSAQIDQILLIVSKLQHSGKTAQQLGNTIEKLSMALNNRSLSSEQKSQILHSLQKLCEHNGDASNLQRDLTLDNLAKFINVTASRWHDIASVSTTGQNSQATEISVENVLSLMTRLCDMGQDKSLPIPMGNVIFYLTMAVYNKTLNIQQTLQIRHMIERLVSQDKISFDSHENAMKRIRESIRVTERQATNMIKQIGLIQPAGLSI